MSQFTSSQQAAIAARGNVLVVAGAGTGKTHTLVERCLALLLDEAAPCSLEHILMVTFTEAAAAEMRHRIRLALLKRQEALPDNDHLARQLALLDTARISTLHGFCLGLVREHFYELGLDPQLTVLDERQTQPLMRETFGALFERHYAGTTPEATAVRDLIRRQGRGSEEAIRALALKIHRYTQTLPNPAKWFQEQLALFAEEEPQQWREWLTEGFVEWAELWLPSLRDVAGEAENVARCVRALESEVRGQRSEAIAAALEEILVADADDWPKKRKTILRDPIKKFFEEAEFLASLARSSRRKEAQESEVIESFPGPEISEPPHVGCYEETDPLAEDWQWVRGPMIALLQLAREFGERFAEAKRELGGVDFADLEQFALRLLRDSDGQPSAIARQWQERFRFIFVDEYQDINEAQDSIIAALSRDDEGANRFLVGDVKQSIYRFRLANPKIFSRYERTWREDAAEGRRIPLADNFRSREGILEFVNQLFSMLMRPSVGGVAYDEDAKLRFGNPEERAALRSGAARVELHLLAKSTDSSGEGGEELSAAESESLDLQTTEREARLVAVRLRELMAEGHAVWDAKVNTFRPVKWGDMVVLMRSPSSRAENFAKEFSRQRVPLLAERGGFYESAEIMDLLSLLHLLDNPLQDVPLLAVLRSPLVGLSLDELAEIRATLKHGRFWTALRRNVECGIQNAELADRLKRFLDQFARWRRRAREGSLSECLETALAETHYEALLEAGPRGAERLANVRRLLALARQFDPYQRQGLFRFLRFVEAQQEAESQEEPAPLPTADAVRLMSVHKSKGLEFPVVVVAGLGNRFNFQDLQGDILLNEFYGLCPKVLPPDADARYPSLTHWLATRRERRELLGEELRLLYVAMTRARDTLVLTGSAASGKASEPWESGEALVPTDREIIEARCPLDWLRLWLPQVTREEDWNNKGSGETALLRWSIVQAGDERLLVEETESAKASGETVVEPDEVSMRELRERILWEYSFGAATVEPAKTTVSVLRRRAADETDDEARRLFEFKVQGSKFKVGRQQGLSAAERGTAHHTFQECVVLARTGSTVELRNEAARLANAGVLTPEQVAALDFDGLVSFWQGGLGQRIRAHGANAHREIPFTARFTTAELAALGIKLDGELAGAATDAEFIVVQGAVDLAVILPEEIWLVDFKTDDVRPSELAEKVKTYVPQVQLYAQALERIYRRPVKQCWLHFLELGRSVAVEERENRENDEALKR